MKPSTAPASSGAVTLLIGTREGAFTLKSDRTRRTWTLSTPIFLGHIIHHVVCDPRDRRTMLMAASTGHLGPTLYRSTDAGKTWKESSAPPAFPKLPEGDKDRSVNHTFWLTPCHANEPNAWYAGTSPQGLFRSDDGGNTWHSFSSINDDPQYREWMGTVQDGTPDSPKLHSILVDPRNPRHLYFAMSGGGVHESIDGGKTFVPLVKRLDTVEGFDPCLSGCLPNPLDVDEPVAPSGDAQGRPCRPLRSGTVAETQEASEGTANRLAQARR